MKISLQAGEKNTVGYSKLCIIQILVLLIISAILVLLGEIVMIMVVLFSVLMLYGEQMKIAHSKASKGKVFLLLYIFSMVFELSAIATGYGKNEFGGGTLFHPDPKMDILISQLYWIPFSIFWTHLFTTYTYTRKSIFLTAGIYGVITEQFFVIPMMIFTFNPWVFVAIPYVFFLYGSAIMIPYLIVENILPKNRKISKWQYLLPMFILFPILITVFVIIHTVVGGW